MVARTSCTRRPHTPRSASSGTRAACACSRSPGGRGVPSGPASRAPRKLLRLAPTSSGRPRAATASRWASSCQLCSPRLAKPRPGSSTTRSGSMPAAVAASQALASSSTTAATTPPGPSYVAKSAIRSLCARQCMATYVASEPATTSRIAGSASPPETSLTIRAPASSAAAATSARMVSTETTAPSAASPEMTGTTRSSSSATTGRVAPGRVDSPPTSRTSAPWASRSRPWASADAVSAYRPPSLKESGVTLTIPITRGRSGSVIGGSGSAPSPRSAWRRCA